jgi:acetylornithine deacetylase
MKSLFSLTRALIDIPSVTGEEGKLARYLAEELPARGFAVHLQEVAPDRFNVFAHHGEPVIVVLCTHLDTVPPHIPSSEDRDHIYGRGACDAKGILAAMVTAAEMLPPHEADKVGLLFVAGEEVDSVGARRANELSVGSRHIIVGEPTENRLASGHKGALEFVIRAEGTAAHSAYPHRGDSAVLRLLEALEPIRHADWGRDTTLGDATVNIGTLAGGVAGNVVPPTAEARVFVRLVEPSIHALRTLDGIVAGDPLLTYEIVTRSEPVRCFLPVGAEASPMAFGSDIPALTTFGEPLMLGPGSIHDAHTEGEKVEKRQLTEGVRLYLDLVGKLLEVR